MNIINVAIDSYRWKLWLLISFGSREGDSLQRIEC